MERRYKLDVICEILFGHWFSSTTGLIVANRVLLSFFPWEIDLARLGQIRVSDSILMDRDSFGAERSKMAKATWGGKVIAESKATVVVEGNQYFPPDAVQKKFLKPSKHTTICPWKGTAHYYHIEVDGMQNDNAAWYYPEPKPAAAEIKDRIAFWKGVRVEV
jgi:uncharacterized protein (DUF427 family)